MMSYNLLCFLVANVAYKVTNTWVLTKYMVHVFHCVVKYSNKTVTFVEGLTIDIITFTRIGIGSCSYGGTSLLWTFWDPEMLATFCCNRYRGFPLSQVKNWIDQT